MRKGGFNGGFIMISQVENKKKLKFGAVWLWCIGEGYEEKENKCSASEE